MTFSTRPAFARTFIAGFIGGSLLTDGVADLAADDPWGWLWLTLGTGAFFLLIQHLREQAFRGLNRPGAAWSRTDTTNTVILLLLVAYVVINTFADKTIQPAEEGAGYTLAAVYTALLIDFTFQRRQVSRTATPAAPTAEPRTPRQPTTYDKVSDV